MLKRSRLRWPDIRINAADTGYTATDLNGHSGVQTVTEGTDAIVGLATEGPGVSGGRFRRPNWRDRLVLRAATGSHARPESLDSTTARTAGRSVLRHPS
jgi:hypothetical protein